MEHAMDRVIGILWGPWTPWVLLFAGVLFTVWTKFTQATAMTHGIEVVKGSFDNPDDPGAINHFQALSAALSATVGLGNISGVALAIAAGGPGALFWMWVVGFFGMALKTIEITLAMMYRNTDDPENPHGGAMWVVDKVLGARGGNWVPIAKAIGIFFCITLVISTFTGGNMFQSWSVAKITHGYFPFIPKVAVGMALAVIVGLVIVGGIKRIGTVAGKLVPFMCVIYLIAAFAVLAMNITEIPSLLWLIVSSAFDTSQATGAFLGGTFGLIFMQGMKRALFSNEAGQGSAPIAHAAAKTGEPAREGIVGGIGPFIDTICICTITALVILSTNTWNRDAIGDFGSDVRLATKTVESTEGDTRAPLVFEVKAGNDLALLPVSEYADWEPGTKFFLVADIVGGERQPLKWYEKIFEERTLRLKISGEVVKGKSEADTAATLQLEWKDIKFKPDKWLSYPSELKLVSSGIYREYGGAELTGHAFDRQFKGLGKWLVTFAAWLFAISTMISWSYYGEQGMVYMLGDKSVLPYKFAFLVSAVLAAHFIDDVKTMEPIMELGTGAMLWANLPIVIGLGYLAVGSLREYKKKLAAGEFKRFDKDGNELK